MVMLPDKKLYDMWVEFCKTVIRDIVQDNNTALEMRYPDPFSFADIVSFQEVIYNFVDVMNVELSINNGSFNGLNAEKVHDLLKNFNLVGIGDNSYFENKYGIQYNIKSNGLNSYFLKIEKLEDLDDSEETIIENFKGVFINDLSGNVLTDGILTLELDN